MWVTREKQLLAKDLAADRERYSVERHLLGIIDGSRDLSKIEAAKLMVDSTDTPVLETVGEVATLMRPTPQATGIGCEIDLIWPR